MTDERRKMLTEKIGEEWHEPTDDVTMSGEYCICSCGWPYIVPEQHATRTFTTPDDWEAVREQIVRPNVHDFVDYLIGLHYGTVEAVFRWFLSIPVLERCELVAEFLEGGE